MDFIVHLHLFDGVSLQDSKVFVGVVFSERSNLVLIWYICSISHFSFQTWHIFLCQIPFLCLHCIFWMYVLGFQVSFSISFQIDWCHPCRLGDWSFLAILLSLSPSHLSTLFWVCGYRGIMAIMNSKGGTDVYLVGKYLFGSLFNPSFFLQVQVFMVFSTKFMTSCDILYILRQLLMIQICRTISYDFL